MNDDPGESFVIDTLTSQVRLPSWVIEGAGDDAAILEDGTVVAADAMVEGVHWDHRLSPGEVGAKLVAVNASDLAACGARSRWALLSLCLPAVLDRPWVEAFSTGLHRELSRVGAVLLGGDTTRSMGGVTAALTLGGQLEGTPLLRSGAGPHQDIWVSGTLGDAAAGFEPDAPEALALAWRQPDPPLDLGPALAREGLATAGMDLSDGLARDLARLCRASSCGATIQETALPASSALLAAVTDPLPYQVSFGEDYQLLFTAQPEHSSAIEDLGGQLDLRLSRIGRTTEESRVRLLERDWPESWQHFRSPA
jgi:thiamine-monophosphate kinase